LARDPHNFFRWRAESRASAHPRFRISGFMRARTMLRGVKSACIHASTFVKSVHKINRKLTKNMVY
jgi:hypothetical protein